ncbi:MAG: outer membrane beta-barrel domain-containing protein [Myxococcales bacterium]|nr:outer membrane beta-barrel domain-containing protein [Myxococcales bacterium]
MKQTKPDGQLSSGQSRKCAAFERCQRRTPVERWGKSALSAILCLGLALWGSDALAQKKGGKPKPAPAAPAAAPAAPAGGEISLDEEPAKPTADTPAAPAAAAGGEGGICEIDPSACPKAEDVKKAAGREVKQDLYAVQQIYALRARRVELNPYWSQTLNDQFVAHPGPGLALNYYLSNVLAIGLNGTYYTNFDSSFNADVRRSARVAVPLNEYLANANLNFSYVPVYGKFAGFGDFIFHFDAYVVGGVGGLWTRPIAVIDPDNRKFDWKPKIAFNAGVGLRIFFNRWFAAMLEVRDYVYQEELESLTLAATQQKQQDPGTWFGDKQLTNNVQAQLGISVFLPFSWEYRLPK